MLIGDAEHLCFRDSSFDLVFSVDVIHHVADQRAYFKEAFRVLKNGGILATLTDSEDTIRRRKPLAFYFPETIEQELKRYPTLSHLKSPSEEAGLRVVGGDIVETPFELTDIEKYERKAFSCLRLISEEAFAAGIANMRQDLQNGPIPCVSRNYVFWNEKSTNK